MAGLGTYFALLMMVRLSSVAGKTFHTRWILWPLMLSFPLPYIANTAGWMTAEIGRQPWIVYGLVEPRKAIQRQCPRATALFTLLGFMGMYTLALDSVHRSGLSRDR